MGDFRRGWALAINRRFYYGWLILAISGLGIFASGPGQSHTFSVFVGPIGADLGISQTTISLAYGIASLAAAFGLPYMGRLVDRKGPRFSLIFVTVGLGFGCILFSMAPGIVWLGLGFAILRFLGQGSMMLNCANITSQWFNRKRGFAIGLMALGFSISMAIHPPVAQWLIDTVGWRQAWVVLGLSTWLLLLPPVLFLVFNRPEDLGLLPDGAKPDAPDTASATAAATSGLNLSQALRTSTFYVLAAGMFTLAGLVTSLHFFQVQIFNNQGLDPSIASKIFPLSAITAVVCMPLVGRALDRFPTPWMFGFGQIVMICSLISSAFVIDLPSAILYGMIFGLNNAITMTMYAFMWPRYFGRAHLGSIQGTGQMIGVAGASLGPLPLGLAFDMIGSYSATLMGLAILPALCIILAFFLKDVRPELMQRG